MYFSGDMGAEAIRDLLAQIDLKRQAEELREGSPRARPEAEAREGHEAFEGRGRLPESRQRART